MDRTDVVIVGGGMAGLSVAATLAMESDLQVVLVEEKEIGSSEGIRAVFCEAISEFHLEESVLQRYKSFVWHSPTGAQARFDYGKAELAGIDYRSACKILMERGMANGRLTLLKCRAVDWSPLIPDPDRPLVVDLGREGSVETEVLVDASGHSQWSASYLQIRPSSYYSVCYGELLSGCSIEDESAFRFLGPCARYGNGGGWLYPCGDGRVSIGYSVVVKNKIADLTVVADGYRAARNEFEPYRRWIEGGIQERIEAGVIPVGRIRQFFSNRILIVGDAGGQAYPWAIEGCRPSLINGRDCARVIIDAFRKRCFSKALFSTFERQWGRRNRNRFWRTSAIADLTWAYPDKTWDCIIRGSQLMTPEQHLRVLRDNDASPWQKVYAVGGYLRRQLVKWCRERIRQRAIPG